MICRLDKRVGFQVKEKESVAPLFVQQEITRGACTTPSYFSLPPIFDYEPCSSLLSPQPSISAVGVFFLSKHPEPILAVISLQFYSVHFPQSQGYSSPLSSPLLSPCVRPDQHALRAAQGTSFRGNSILHIIPRVLQQKMRQNASVVPRYPSLSSSCTSPPQPSSLFPCLLLLLPFSSLCCWGSSSGAKADMDLNIHVSAVFKKSLDLCFKAKLT